MIEDGRVTAAGVEALLKSEGVEMESGLEIDAVTEVNDEGAVVALGAMTVAGAGGIPPSVPGCDTRALDPPKLVNGL